ncbi:transcription termination factor 2, mitochondrial [Sceloporus undulatus]|uniref:transcription termination factor 2, mitochondrial n=1 Tax=Sceloporus undulatus TaxID=8520 RepID=UPI001C4BBB5B|nr:transcription termination factor 2, mitochondrial [Sceloporus undulatus]XP_042324615.1 transcription termination factor 2, mitochondrial [Sceloporus undulatus]XP_042324616.1 transcription termination factor 2, mitochondrial [Sceloporus undulatus]
MANAPSNLCMNFLARFQPIILMPGLSALEKHRKNGRFLQHFRYATHFISGKENKATVESLSELSVDIKKIRRLKPWVLSKELTYVKETAKILQKMGADESSVAYIFECCPEGILCSPTDVSCQRDLWLSVCQNEKRLVELIKRFPDSFFTVGHYENQKANVEFFKDLGLRNIIISRLLTSASNIFHNPVAKNKQMVETLQSIYLRLGGSQENMKNWLLKLLSQNPFILLNISSTIQENLEFLQKNKFTDSEVLSLVSKLKGFIVQLHPATMQNSLLFSKNIFKCTDQELKELILKCPALLYHSVPVLEDRLKELLKAGISVDQIKETPAVLELSTEIVQYRIKKLNAIGFSLKTGTLEYLNGTKKDFETTYGKIQAKSERPIFNPVAPLHIDD